MKKHNVMTFEPGELIIKSPSGLPEDFSMTIVGNLNVVGSLIIGGGDTGSGSISENETKLAIDALTYGNDERGITVTYNYSTEKLDFVVDSFNLTFGGDVSGTGTINSLSDTTIDLSVAYTSLVNVPPNEPYPSFSEYYKGIFSLDAVLSPSNPVDDNLDQVFQQTNYTGIGMLDKTNDTGAGFMILMHTEGDGTTPTGRPYVVVKDPNSTEWSEPKALAWYEDVDITTNNSPTLTLGGDASGSATFTNLNDATLIVEVIDDSHNHSASTIVGLDEFIQDTVGGMISGNVESGITVSYDDASGKLNFAFDGDLTPDWETLLNKPVGNPGDLYYINDTGDVEVVPIYYTGYMVDTQDKLDYYLTEHVSSSGDRVFDTRDDSSWTYDGVTWTLDTIGVYDIYGYGKFIQDVHFGDMYYTRYDGVTSGTITTKITSGIAETVFGQAEFDQAYNNRMYTEEVVLVTGGTHTISLDVVFSSISNLEPRNALVSVKVLDQNINSVTYNEWIEADAVSFYSITGNDLRITNTFNVDLTVYVMVRV